MVKRVISIGLKRISSDFFHNILVFILGIIALAEFLALMNFGKNLSVVPSKILSIYKWAYLWVGPVLIPLFILNVLEIFVIIRLLLIKHRHLKKRIRSNIRIRISFD